MTYETVADFAERLQELVDAGYGDCRLRIATQPNWPLAHKVAAMSIIEDGDRYEGEEEDGTETVWIAASETVGYDENPYAPRDAWDEW